MRYPLLLAIPFLAGIAILKGLTVEVDTFHGNDAGIYHLPTIMQFSQHLSFESYPAAQTPLYHVLFAGYGKLVGFDLWKLRLLNVVISYGAVLAIYGLLLRRLERLPAFAFALLIGLSPYVLGPSFTLLTDNLALLFGVLALWAFDRARKDASLAAFALGCLAMSGAVLTRQAFLWLALVAAWALLRGRFDWRQRALGIAAGTLALAPFFALVITWGGLVPKGSDPASCGLCTEGDSNPFTLRTVGFTLAVVGLYGAFVFLPTLWRRKPHIQWRWVGVAVLWGAALLLISPMAVVAPRPGKPADAGYLWRAAERGPEIFGSAPIFWLLVPLGTLTLALLVRRARIDSLPTVWFGSFLLAALPVRLVYAKYFDPFALLALALFAKAPDLRRPLDYAGIAVLCVAFTAYALIGAG